MAYQKGSGFVGLNQYLGANQQQAQQMGNTVAGRLEGDIANTVSATQSGLDDAVSRVQSQAAAGTPQYVAPTSQDDADAKLLAARYTGPHGLSAADVAAARGGMDTATQQGKLGLNDAGVATLLQQQYGNGYTGVGGRSLDAALTRRGAGERLDKAGSSGVDKLKAYLGDATTKAIAAGEQGMMDAANVRGQIAAYNPTPYLDTGVQRNRIATPGTMPEKQPKQHNTPFDRFGRWLFGGGN
jgi:hypothetical protein